MPCPEWEVAVNSETMSKSVRPEWLGQQLDDGLQLLLMDCRAPTDYNASHIVGAIHVAIPGLMLRRLKKGNLSLSSFISDNESRDRFARHCKTDTVVIYDDRTSDVNVNSNSAVSLLIGKLREDGCRVHLLEGGFESFQEICPDYCLSLEDASEEQTILGLESLRISCDTDPGAVDEEVQTPTSSTAFPVQVLPDLYLGNARNSADLECLYKNRIRYILNVTPNVPNTFDNNPNFKYKQIPINDHWSQNLAHYFPEAIKFIDEARAEKSGVLVHCLAGVSRSVTVTVAYLMSSMSLSLNDAYDYVKRCKPNISPNFNFMGQLLDFEKTLNQGSMVCTCCCSSSESGSAASSASSTGEEYKCQCTQSFFTSPVTTPPMFTSNTEISATPS